MAPGLQQQSHFHGNSAPVGVPSYQVGAIGLGGEDVQSIGTGKPVERGGRMGSTGVGMSQPPGAESKSVCWGATGSY